MNRRPDRTLIICGGRDYDFDATDISILEMVDARFKPSTVMTGGARGADTWGRAWAEVKGINVKTVKANWEKHGKRAGIVRNLQMLWKSTSDVGDGRVIVVAFPGGVGTRHMISASEYKGVFVLNVGKFRAMIGMQREEPKE